MRTALAVLACTCAMAIGAMTTGAMAAGLSAFAAPVDGHSASATSSSTINGQLMPIVAPGDEVAIACAPVESRSADSDVRVVLTISAAPGESDPGYQKVLATDEQLLKDSVKVRIPEAPSLADHTVDLDVYVVNDTGSQHCSAGPIAIM